MAKVAWIGLGVMGYPMAGHLAKKGGHDLTVYNRNGAKAEAWVKEYGTGKTAPTPADAAKAPRLPPISPASSTQPPRPRASTFSMRPCPAARPARSTAR
jgi:hypothetical protein